MPWLRKPAPPRSPENIAGDIFLPATAAPFIADADGFVRQRPPDRKNLDCWDSNDRSRIVKLPSLSHKTLKAAAQTRVLQAPSTTAWPDSRHHGQALMPVASGVLRIR